ncbi:nocobactin polyketide synthase NbtC [Nocardia cyriacigeorgica]|uniref:nocobactin polyketide synthase NbtC n=1 Tax=Nocardia cyriacigeorgica TaxID=135487 RepID=UPI0013D26F83|nr:nocobactin polyketide synthase NbtC [Nocardia cyriacigeorgica]NEW30005.1 nocobactin polyketide synthase NbtC [Nocardia cyriacigeorgica]
MSSHRLPDGTIPVLLSSDTDESLRREAAAILDYVDARPALTPDQVAAQLLRTRVPRRRRALAMVTDRDQLLAALRAVAAGEPHPAVVTSGAPARPRKIAYVFPGQGSQRPGMGRMFYEHSPVFRAAVDECEAVFQELFGISPLTYLLDGGDAVDEVTIVQPALFMQMIGLAAIWRAVGVEPAATVGHSQGEIAAAVVSGVISLADGVRVVTLRAQLVEELCPEGGTDGQYSMAVLGVDRDECEALIARSSAWAELSVVNSAHVLAISGEREAVVNMVQTLNDEGTFAKEIRVAYPAHTSYVSKFRSEFCDGMADKLDRPTFQETSIDCIGATLGAPITPDLPVGDYWFWNLRNRVRFDLAIIDAAERGIDTFIEIADHPALMIAIMENLSQVPGDREFQPIGTSRRSAEDLAEFTRNLAAIAVGDLDFDWDGLRIAGANERPPLPLLDFPNTEMNSKPMWAPFDYPEPETEPAAVPTRLVEQWVRLEKRTLVPPRTLTLIDPTGRCGELAEAVRAGAARQGAKIVDAPAAFDTAVVLLPPPPDGTTESAVAELAAFANLGWLPELDGVADIWLVTRGGEAVTGDEQPDLFQAAAQAGFRCLAPEHLGVRFRHVDLAPGADAAASAKALLGAVHTAGEPELAIREGGVYGKRLTVDEGTALDPGTPREIVIAGGTGKLGLDICERFARAGAGRITLISRSGGNAEARARIAELRALGGTDIVVRTGDVTDADSVRALAADHGAAPVDLLVHATVDYGAAAAELTPETVRAAAAAKLGALDNLVRALPLAEDGRVLLCSSLSATIGGRGHLLYAAVNRMLDAAAARLRAEGIACSSVQWGLWREVGADQADALAQISGTGLYPMDVDASIAAGFTEAAANALVVAADWGRVATLFEVFGFGPLFDQVRELAPPVLPEARKTARPAAEPAVETRVAVAEPAPEAAPASGGDTAERVRFALRSVMGMDATETIDGSTPLVALGLDSLQALDLRKRIESDLQRDVPVTAILGGASLDEVVSLLG